MNKRVCLVALFIGLGVFVSGCGDKNKLTDDESAIVAQYCADLILKYDRGYDVKYSSLYLSSTDSSSENESEESSTADTQQTTSITTTAQGSQGSGEVSNEEYVTDISDIYGDEGISVQYVGYDFLSKYPETTGKDVVTYVDANSGMELIVVRFKITNNSGSDKTIDYLSKNINYQIVLNNTKAAKPMITLLLDDLSSLETTISNGESTDAVLVFQISQSLKSNINSLRIDVSNGDLNSKKILLESNQENNN